MIEFLGDAKGPRSLCMILDRVKNKGGRVRRVFSEHVHRCPHLETQGDAFELS